MTNQRKFECVPVKIARSERRRLFPRAMATLAAPSARHEEARLAAWEDVNLARALERALNRIPGEDRHNDKVLVAAAQRFVRREWRWCAPTARKLLSRARRGRIDSFTLRWTPLNEDLTRFFAAITACALGEPFNYSTQNGGALIMEIRPAEDAPDNSQSTRNEFTWHSDDAFVPRGCRCAWILLTGHINPAGTRTHYAPIRPASEALSEEHLRWLFGKNVSVRAPKSFNFVDDIWSGPRSVLSLNEKGQLEVAWPSYATRRIDPADTMGEEALAALKSAIDAQALSVAIDAGVLFGLCNLRGVHSRDAIGDGQRLVFRTYVVGSFDELCKTTGEDGPVFDVLKTIPPEESA